MRTDHEVVVGDRRLALTNLGKLMYPEADYTKAQVIDYYVRIAPVLLAHLKGRPLTMKRYPDGVHGQFFYEKRCPEHRPSWVRTAPIRSKPLGRAIHYCLVEDLPTLVWVANLADLELHTSLSLAENMSRPTMVVFDLDPGLPADIIDCCDVALLCRGMLERLGLASFPKTSGAKGLQVYVPLNTPVTYGETKRFSRAMAEALAENEPSRVVALQRKSLRSGRVLVDWSQNDEHKTTVCVYSLRATPTPRVSTPVTWDEVRRAARTRDVRQLALGPDEVLQRVEASGDLFAGVLELEQRLPDTKS
ncbi:MAG: ATP-dependent DNA ligase [Deltaproteobacteria bacterium]|nr:ATP-dependent DNA ligase [Deltaproteobacteria bacterium]